MRFVSFAALPVLLGGVALADGTRAKCDVLAVQAVQQRASTPWQVWGSSS